MKVLVLGNYTKFVEDLKKLVTVDCEFISIKSAKPEEILKYIEDIDIIFGSRVTKEVLKRAKKLKLIQVIGAGVSERLLKEVRDLEGIRIANTHGNYIAVAEHAIALVMALAKKLTIYDKYFRKGIWLDNDPKYFNIQLKGKVLGIIGLGHIGRYIAKLGKGLGMKVIAIKRTYDEKLKRDLGLDFLGDQSMLSYVLENSDFLVIAVPRTKETKNMIGIEELKKMKRTAYLINISRGDIVNEEALYTALKEKIIAGAGLDVWYIYPDEKNKVVFPSRFPFHELDNVIMTPHIAWKTPEALRGLLEQVAENINRIGRGEPPINIIDKELGY
ncbi:MAG: 2-hydroxyacid dehydrogenase [Candidatus Asgardarchaeia archaeon]